MAVAYAHTDYNSLYPPALNTSQKSVDWGGRRISIISSSVSKVRLDIFMLKYSDSPGPQPGDR